MLPHPQNSARSNRGLRARASTTLPFALGALTRADRRAVFSLLRAHDRNLAAATCPARLWRVEAQRSCSARSARSNGSAQTHSSPATPASHRSKRAPASTNATASTAAQPTTQLRAPPDRDHTSTRPRTRSRLRRTQTERSQNPPRSNPLPQTPTRPHRLLNPENRASIDIGATLAQARGLVANAEC
jgi:hypothetical protein